jgi:hypothetical protein
LPVVAWDDSSGSLFGWWNAEEAPQPYSPLDTVFFARAAEGSWVDVRDVAPNDVVSRVLQTVPLTPRNAVALGALYDAETVAVGEAWIASIDTVPWLGLVRVGVGVDVELIDVASGARRGRVETIGLGVASNEADAVEDACEMAVARLETMTRAVATHAPHSVETDGPLIVVSSTPTASPFVAFRTALRTVHPGVIDVHEAFATEGAVALGLDLDEGVVVEAVLDSIEALGGATLDGARVVHVDRSGMRLDVVVSPVFDVGE